MFTQTEEYRNKLNLFRAPAKKVKILKKAKFK